MRANLVEVFSIDLRSLALVRIAIAGIILQDLARRAFDIAVFYGKGGVLPPPYPEMFWNGEWAWSLHLIGGGPQFLIIALFFVQALAALALFFGFHTRLAAVVTWVLLISLHNANPLILQGEDVLLRAVLFVSLFLPIGAVFSLDRFIAKKPSRERRVLSGWSVAYLLQIGFLYYFVSLYKHSAEWLSGDAIYYALSIDQYATALGKFLLHFPDLLTLLTYSVLILQTLALFLLFFPFHTNVVRITTVLLLICMHAAFALSMHLAMFSAVSIAALLGFLPSSLWDRAERFLSKRYARARDILPKLTIAAGGEVTPNVRAVPKIISMLGIAYICYIFLWHALGFLNQERYGSFNNGFELPAEILRLDQRWNLFAPYPYRDDGWIIIAAENVRGEEIDLFRNGAVLSFERPEVIYDLYPQARWRRYFLNLRRPGDAEFRVPFAEYLCNDWNGAHAESRITSVEILYMLERTPAPGEMAVAIVPTSMLRWDCDRNAALQPKWGIPG